MTDERKTIIITGASQGIGAVTAGLFLDLGYNVVANSRHISENHTLRASDRLTFVDGDIALPETADRLVENAMTHFGSVDALVNNAGIFISKPFTAYTREDFQALASTNIEGFLYITQRVVRYLLAQNRSGSVVSITASIADHPLTELPASVAMITKGGINSISLSLSIEFARHGIRFNTVAPGVVDTPLLRDIPRSFLRSLSPLGEIGSPLDIAHAVVYLTEAQQVTGEVLHVNGGSHVGKW